MTDPDTIREIQRLMNESGDAMHDSCLNARRIARLLGIHVTALCELQLAEHESAPDIQHQASSIQHQ